VIFADVHSNFLVWHDQFKTSLLAQAATFSLVAADTTPITNDNTDIHAKVTSVNSPSATATQAVADKNTSRANANKHARALAEEEGTGANRGNGEGILCSLRSLVFKSGSGGVVELDFDKSISDGVNIYAKRDGDADFVFLARDTASLAAPKSDEGGPYIDNRPWLVATKPELRKYKAVFVIGDQEVSQFSDEITVNCAPLVQKRNFAAGHSVR